MQRFILLAVTAIGFFFFSMTRAEGQFIQFDGNKVEISPLDSQQVVVFSKGDTAKVSPQKTDSIIVVQKRLETFKAVPTPKQDSVFRVTVGFYTRAEAVEFAKKHNGYVTEVLQREQAQVTDTSLIAKGKDNWVVFFNPEDTLLKKQTVVIPAPVVKTPTTFMAIAQEEEREVQPKIIPQTGDRPLHGYVVGQHVSLTTNEYPIGYELLPTSQGGGVFLGRIIYYKKEIADSLAETKGMSAVDFLHNPKQVWETLPYQGTQGWRIQILTVTSEPYLISEGVFFFKDASVNKWYGYLTSFFADKASADVALIKVRELYPDAFVRTSRW